MAKKIPQNSNVIGGINIIIGGINIIIVLRTQS